MADFKMTWRANDGYVNAGPQSFKVRTDDFCGNESIEDVAKEIESMIQDDFDAKVHASYNMDDVLEIAEKIVESFKTTK